MDDFRGQGVPNIYLHGLALKSVIQPTTGKGASGRSSMVFAKYLGEFMVNLRDGGQLDRENQAPAESGNSRRCGN